MSDSDGGVGLGQDGVAEIDSEQPPTKRRAMGKPSAGTEDDTPKWSNPDPYSVLPPTADSDRKRKDPVKLIRKAFNLTEESQAPTSQVAANDDFISFNDAADDDDTLSEEELETMAGIIRLDLGGRPRDYAIEADIGPGGDRKRSHGDMIKGHETGPAVSAARANGCLLVEWVPRSAAHAVPWLHPGTASTLKTAFKLHREVCDFYEYVRPQPYEQLVREDLLRRLQSVASNTFPSCKQNPALLFPFLITND